MSRVNSVVCWDLDSTLANTWHRQHMVPLIKAGEATWDDYSLACADDEPIEAAVILMRLLWPHHQQHAVSGRSAAAAGLTRSWARKHEIPLDHIELRPEGDTTENGLFKVGYVKRLQAEDLDVRLFVEDWPDSAEFIRRFAGVPVLVVNPCYPDAKEPGNENAAAAKGDPL